MRVPLVYTGERAPLLFELNLFFNSYSACKGANT
jgi:hypothetical protein